MKMNVAFWKKIIYFKKNEFDCKCNCGLNNISDKLIEKLDKARFLASVPFVINSACRCNIHNKNVGGSFDSSHKKGLAIDIEVTDSIQRFNIINALLFVGFKRIGIYKDFIHVDIDITKTDSVVWYK